MLEISRLSMYYFAMSNSPGGVEEPGRLCPFSSACVESMPLVRFNRIMEVTNGWNRVLYLCVMSKFHALVSGRKSVLASRRA